jgi:hypothetical protein
VVAARNEYEPLLVVLRGAPAAFDGAAAAVPGTDVEFTVARASASWPPL